MTVAQKTEALSPKLLKVMERAKRDPEVRFTSLAHLIDEEALKRAYQRLRKQAAEGVDGITKEQYGQELDSNVSSLHQRLKTQRYRHQPVLRVHIPKDRNKTRPIGISCIEDKLVQGALKEVLEAVYEPVFRDISYGFRPGRSAHDALRTLDGALMRGEVNWILEADIQTFFDSLDRKKLAEMLRERIADKSLLRLIGKCLRAGVLDGEEYSEPDEGTVQGSSLSPLLGNVYLHHVLDLWFEQQVLPRLCGKAMLIRYCDDFVMAFQYEADAQRVMAVLGQRFQRYGLKLHPEKTRLLPFGRPRRGLLKGKGGATFDFLGFTVLWTRTRTSGWKPRFKTRKARLRRAVVSVADWCRRHRHQPVKEQHAALTRRLQGHMNYFGVNGNIRSIVVLIEQARLVWRKWLGRRGQRHAMSWEKFEAIERDFPLPVPRICVQLWYAP
jgi:group II intron reverse transcriptase/maturase